MVFSNANGALRRDKHQFFSKISTESTFESKIQMLDERVENVGYTFLLENKNALEAEFHDMFTTLQKQDAQNKEIFWFYCYYCASLLEAFHNAYLQHSKATQYAKIRQQIKDRLNHISPPSEPETSFIDFLYHSFINDFRSLINSPYHISQIRDYVAYANLCRIYWTFCRLTLTSGLNLAKSSGLIDKLDVLLNTHTDVNKIISTLQIPSGVLNYFSVGFFLARFMIDFGLLLKHTFFPTPLEKGEEKGCEINKLHYLPDALHLDGFRNSYVMVQEDEDSEMTLYYIPKIGHPIKLHVKEKAYLQKALCDKLNKQKSMRLSAQDVKNLITAHTQHKPEATSAFDRFKHELYKRHCNYANDLIWATVNLLTNFNYLFGISAPMAGYLTVIFLAFDVCMIIYKSHSAKKEYLAKKSQYLAEIADYHNPDKFKELTTEQRLLHVEMLHKQLIELEINWRTKEATFYYLEAAAILFMIGFTSAILLSAPAILVSFIAAAMYLSTDSYSKYKEKSLYLEQAKVTGQHLDIAQKEYEAACNDFIFTMVKNACLPLVLITLFAIYWPAAIILTAVYIGYELFHASAQHSAAKEVKQLAIASPDEELNPDLDWLPASVCLSA